MRIAFCENGIHFAAEVTEAGDVRLMHCAAVPLREESLGDEEDRRWFRLVEVQCAGGSPQDHQGAKHIASDPGSRLRYRDHADDRNAQGRKLEIRQEIEGLLSISHFQFYDGVPVIRAWTELRNAGLTEWPLEYVSSFSLAGLSKESAGPAVDTMRVHMAHNTWHGEGQWRRLTLDDLGLRPVQGFAKSHSIKRFSVENTGTWSSGGCLPMGAVENAEAGLFWLWQIENSGSWQWEFSTVADHFYAKLSGPTFQENHWFKRLRPGERFLSVPVAVACTAGGFEEAVAAMTRYRRRLRRPDASPGDLPVIFNDYMHCLFGDATSAKLYPLIDAAAGAGCEVFVLDAGWYSEIGTDWWSSKGLWEASSSRFPEGLPSLLRRIRGRGMIPGLWLEPEAMGVQCRLAREWPDSCFFSRHGRRVTENGMHLLDFRHPVVRAHLDRVVDRLAGEWGVGYIKIDYNVNAGPGTEIDADSLGDGLQQHLRAYLDWLDGVLLRYPRLLLENCAGGGMRMDWAMLPRHGIQSTSDQTDYRKTAVVAACAPAAVTPEQCGVWVYPLAAAGPEAAAFNMVNAMLGRIQLSGQVSQLDSTGLALVREAVGLYKRLRPEIPRGVPAWPTGLPGFGDEWATYALRCGHIMYLSVWRRDAGPVARCAVPLERFAPRDAPELLYPSGSAEKHTWDAATGELTVRLEQPPQARLFRVRCGPELTLLTSAARSHARR